MSDQSPQYQPSFSQPYLGGNGNAFTYSPLTLKNPGINFCLLQTNSQSCSSWPIYQGSSLIVGLLIFVFFIGYFFGNVVGKRKTVETLAKERLSNEALYKWSHKQTTVNISYLLIVSGLFFLLVGVSGTVEFEFQGAKIVTSLPGLVITFLGFLTWHKSKTSDA